MPVTDERCKACGAPMMGRFCQSCGQRHRHDLPTLGAFAREAAGSLFDLDGPLRSTLRMLVLRPGALTEAYWAGRHSRYVSPIKLYVAASALYFVVSRSLNANAALFIRFVETESSEGMLRLMEPLMILIVPAFGAIVMAVRRDGRRYLAHLVFALHVHTAWFLLLALSVALDAVITRLWGATPAKAFDVAQVLALVYLLSAMLRAYELPPGRASLQAFFVMLLYLGLMIPAALFITGFGAT